MKRLKIIFKKAYYAVKWKPKKYHTIKAVPRSDGKS
jgi:hypothetical protein